MRLLTYKTTTLRYIAVVMTMFGLFSFGVAPVSALDPGAQLLDGVNRAGGNAANKRTPQSAIKKVTNVMLFILGAISVIMIIFGGIRFVVSNGDSSAVTGAKNTILYAVIGLVVALLAYAIVNFILKSF